MPKVKVVDLTAEQRQALQHGAKYGATPSFRLRCQAILCKSQPRASLAVAQELGCCEMAVNNWVRRFAQHGVHGLQVKAGRGRKAILQTTTDLEAVRRAVQNSRQKISLAKAELEKELGKEFGMLTLKRFLKKTVAATNGCGDA